MKRWVVCSNGIVIGTPITHGDEPPEGAKDWVAFEGDVSVGDIANEDGTYSRPAADIEDLRRRTIATIKLVREQRQNAGVQVDSLWFHTDVDSRIKYQALKLLGPGVPAARWKTMDGTFVVINEALVSRVFAAVVAHDIAVFGHAETLIDSVRSSEDPLSIDINAGWPAKRGD